MHLKHIVELANSHQVTTIKFQPYNKLFLRENNDEFFIDESQISSFQEVVYKVIELCNSYGISTNPRSYLEKLPFYLGKRALDLKKRCIALFVSAPINCAGELYPCWVMADKKYLIADLRKTRLLKVWNSLRHASLRKAISEKGCSGCIMSCYDDNFGIGDIRDRVQKNIGILNKHGFMHVLNKHIKKWSLRLRFYSSYRRKPGLLFSKLRNFLIKRNNQKVSFEDEFSIAREEIKKAKRILQGK
jgi:radical SAM protein with 4Fe4S-binding SPASM domain